MRFRGGRAALPLALLAAALSLAWLAAALALPAPPAAADSFTPVNMSESVTAVARLNAPLRTTVSVSADPGVLDVADGQLRVEAKLAGECGGDFQTTPGVTLVNAPLHPQPSTGRAYSGKVTGSGRPSAYGVRTVCTFLEDSEDRVYANDESTQVDVTPACTTAGLHYDAAERSLKRDQRQLRHAHGAARRRLAGRVATAKRTVRHDHQLGLAACGRGVPL